jgi:hypothetical protein
MQTWMFIVLVAIAALIVGLMIYDRTRSNRLRQRFGPAYDQTVSELGSRRRAEARLQRREVHAKELRDRPMDPSDRERFTTQWKQCQARFVDDPAGAVEEADELLAQIMRSRGYAADNFYERSTDVAAAFPHNADRYRQACELIEQHRRSPLSTDKLRTAFLNYRDLFTDFIGGYDEKLRRAS